MTSGRDGLIWQASDTSKDVAKWEERRELWQPLYTGSKVKIQASALFCLKHYEIWNKEHKTIYFVQHYASSTVKKRYTGCPRRNVPEFGRVFLMLNYTDISQNTYIQSWTVTEIIAIEMCGLLGCPRTVRRPWRHTHPLRMPGNEMQWPWRMLYSTVSLTSQDNSQLRPT